MEILELINRFGLTGCRLAFTSITITICINKNIVTKVFYEASDDSLLELLKEFLHVVKSEEYQWIENNLFDLVVYQFFIV